MTLAESVLNTLYEIVAQVAVGIQNKFAPVGGDGGRVRGRPVFEFRRQGSGHLDCAVLSFWSERNNQIERRVIQFFERLGPVAAEIDTDLLHGRRGKFIHVPLAHANRLDKRPVTVEMLHDRFGHGRAYGV